MRGPVRAVPGGDLARVGRGVREHPQGGRPPRPNTSAPRTVRDGWKQIVHNFRHLLTYINGKKGIETLN